MPEDAPILSFLNGISMLPLLHAGDQVEQVPVARKELRCGDIIVFPGHKGGRLIHRVVRISPLQTRGDNCGQDDPPVPDNVPVLKAVAFLRKGIRHPLTSGEEGLKEFRRHQRRRRWRLVLRKALSPLCLFNPLKIPSDCLTHATFGERRVYYAGERPVGWYDRKGWHWMHLARFFVQKPPEP